MMDFFSRFRFALIALLASCVAPGTLRAADQKPKTDLVVQQALQAEVEGDGKSRQKLLDSALEQDPQHAAARWHSGYIQVGPQWLSVEEAERKTAESELIGEYRRLRDQHFGSLVGEQLLARWCRKHGLQDRENMHWTNVLTLDPTNREARTRLGVRSFRGQWMTAAQIASWKRLMKERQRALDDWDPQLLRWRREIEGSSLPHLTDAWEQLSSLDDPAAVPSLEKLLPRVDDELKRQFVSVLGNIEDQAATDALVRLALQTESSELRHAAANELGERSWFGFVPSLLSQLETPVEYRYVLETLGAGVVSKIQFSKETPQAVVNSSYSVTTGVPVYIVPENRTVRNQIRMQLLQQKKISEAASRQYRSIQQSVQAVEHLNAQRVMFNERIYSVLKISTGQSFESQPKSWWDWWSDYNELENSEEKPYINLRQRRYYDRSIRLKSLSCFVAGTPVWTESGAIDIEKVRRGDRVLSQDPLSGELGYRIVSDTTTRPASPTLRIGTTGDEIVATLGHPLWVVGKGWRMAKELNVGDRLHGVGMSVTVSQIDPGPTSKAYNLVVDKANTYFVGKQRVLVHDNMPRQAVDVPIPGWSQDESN